MVAIRERHRHCQPFAVATAGAAEVASIAVLGGSRSDALFVPFHPFDIRPFEGSVARSDGHRVGERKPACPNRDGANPH